MIMNSTMDKQLTSLVGWLVDSAKQTQHFILSQAPDIFREIIRYRTIHYSIVLALGILLLAVAGLFLTLAVKYARILAKNDAAGADEKKLTYSEESGVETRMLISIFIALAFSCFGILAVYEAVDSLIFIYCAPKLYILHYLVGNLGHLGR